MQGMSDLGKPPASLGSVSLDSQGQKSWSHDGGNRLEQASAGKSFQVLPIAVRPENQALLARGDIVHIVMANGMASFADHHV